MKMCRICYDRMMLEIDSVLFSCSLGVPEAVRPSKANQLYGRGSSLLSIRYCWWKARGWCLYVVNPGMICFFMS